MKDLFIFTTYQRYLPSNGEGKGLFNKGNCEEIPSPHLSEVFGKPHPLWRLQGEDELVFGTACLDKDQPEDRFSAEKKAEYIKALFRDVLGFITERTKNKQVETSHIFLFAHGFDLDWHKKVNIGPFDEHTLLDEHNLQWLKDLLPKKKIVVRQTGRKTGSGETGVHFTAFSHVPHPLFNLLETGKPIFSNEDMSVSTQLGNFSLALRGWNMEQYWLDNLYQKDIPPGSLPFSFRFYYAADNVLTAKMPEDFPYAEIQKDYLDAVQNPASGRLVNVVFLPLTELAAFNNEQQEFYHKVVNTFHAVKNKNRLSTPTLFISFRDIMSESFIPEGEVFEPDPRYKFLDSSIWYRYVPIEGNFTKNLDIALRTIGWAYENELYSKNVCREYVEFQNRLVLNSYLDDTFGSGHAKRVFPFTFHSETAMRKNADEIIRGFREKQLIWNFLLVDDYAKSSLREGNSIGGGPTKGELITSLVENAPGETDETPPSISRFSPHCENVDEAAAAIIDMNSAANGETKVQDIILLDYLFSHKLQYPHYGTDLLKKIEAAEERKGLGVLQSYWIYPISVFNEAIQSVLQEKGYQYLEKHWHLARGADPLNTPHLFRRTLYEFMQAQAGRILFEENDLWQFIADNPLSETEKQQEKTRSAADRKKLNRELAIKAFRRFVERFSVDEGLPEGSALSESILKRLKDSRTQDIRDHMRLLLYLLGFSVGFDFPIIEREFRFLEDAFSMFHAQKIKDIEEKKSSGNNYDDITALINAVNKAMGDLSVAIYSISGKYF